jgi:hypothetical protein
MLAAKHISIMLGPASGRPGLFLSRSAQRSLIAHVDIVQRPVARPSALHAPA